MVFGIGLECMLKERRGQKRCILFQYNVYRNEHIDGILENDLDNLSSELTGNGNREEEWMRFKGEPYSIEQFLDYIRSCKWLYEQFYFS